MQDNEKNTAAYVSMIQEKHNVNPNIIGSWNKYIPDKF